MSTEPTGQAGKAAEMPTDLAPEPATSSGVLPARRDVFDRFKGHALKVEPPYFDALASGDKTFEVRKNDRGYQRGDLLFLTEWHRCHPGQPGCGDCHTARIRGESGHYVGRTIRRWVSFVYSGDPRFGGIEAGHVVLGLVRTEDAPDVI